MATTRGRIYLDVGERKAIDRTVPANAEVRVTYYPTGSSMDDPLTIYLRRLNSGKVALTVTVSDDRGQWRAALETVIDQPEGAKEQP